ncbi:MAG: DEAD/DEAH box helicase, partial [Chloroflexota bacterium]|nr:DEAD/DEAH box helicase [Chloroflexota bacterium]
MAREAPVAPFDAGRFVERLRRAGDRVGRLAHVERLPPRPAEHAALSHDLHPALTALLEGLGVLPLYRHQAAAVDALLDGQDAAVVTPAASGKSLCYQAPIVHTLLEDSSARALLLFPTKALAQDQLRSLRRLLTDRLGAHAAIFDGDTPPEERGRIRRSANLVLTNPDMLHLGILPNHRYWGRFLRNLRFVVVDEAHVYRGIFGSHTANVLRRLRRLCAHYGGEPRFALCSATIANAGELARRLTGREALVIDDDGSPSGGKHFAFWNPPIVDEERSERASAGSEAARLVEALVKQEVRTLAFVRTRRQAEVVYANVGARLGHEPRGGGERVRPYRASYLPEDKRAVERGLADGRLSAVVATNALELGIDIGDLDATVLAGYPGSVASTWQQAGRSGRSMAEALSVLIAQDNPLDQYLMRHPDFFFGSPHEHARIRPENPHVLGAHLLCAAYEKPITQADATYLPEGFEEAAQGLAERGLLNRRGSAWRLSPSVDYPAQRVNIRSAWDAQYLAVEAESGRILERVEEYAAHSQLHPGAVYLHQGEPYMVERLDLEAREAYLRPTDVPYYTEARELVDIRVVKTHAAKVAGAGRVFVGEVEVSRAVAGFWRKRLHGRGDYGYEQVDVPEQRFRTVGVWFDIPGASLDWALKTRADLAGGLH